MTTAVATLHPIRCECADCAARREDYRWDEECAEADRLRGDEDVEDDEIEQEER